MLIGSEERGKKKNVMSKLASNLKFTALRVFHFKNTPNTSEIHSKSTVVYDSHNDKAGADMLSCTSFRIVKDVAGQILTTVALFDPGRHLDRIRPV